MLAIERYSTSNNHKDLSVSYNKIPLIMACSTFFDAIKLIVNLIHFIKCNVHQFIWRALVEVDVSEPNIENNQAELGQSRYKLNLSNFDVDFFSLCICFDNMHDRAQWSDLNIFGPSLRRTNGRCCPVMVIYQSKTWSQCQQKHFMRLE